MLGFLFTGRGGGCKFVNFPAPARSVLDDPRPSLSFFFIRNKPSKAFLFRRGDSNISLINSSTSSLQFGAKIFIRSSKPTLNVALSFRCPFK